MEDAVDVLADVWIEISVDEDFKCLKEEEKVKVCKRC